MTTNTTLAKSTSVRDLSEIFSLHTHHGLVDAIKGLFGEWGDTA